MGIIDNTNFNALISSTATLRCNAKAAMATNGNKIKYHCSVLRLRLFEIGNKCSWHKKSNRYDPTVKTRKAKNTG